MGCYNETCAITNLPIRCNDRVVGIALEKSDCTNSYVYPDSEWRPIGFPVFGKYDEYGGIVGIVTHPWNKSLLGITNKLNDKEIMFIHEGVYKQIIQVIGNRKPVGKSANYKDNLYDSVLRRLNNVGAVKPPFQIGEYANARVNQFFYNLYKSSNNEDEKRSAIHYQVECELLYNALVLLRKGYRTISGAGSQSIETALHIIVARFIIDFGQRILLDEDNQEIQPNGNEEAIFFFG